MKIFVTGGAGFIGSKLVNVLYSLGHQVVVMDSLSPQVHGSDKYQSDLYKAILGKCEFLEQDICAVRNWDEIVSTVDAIVHLAAETGTGQSMYEIERYESVNCLATSRLVEALVRSRIPLKRFVVSSSRAVYGEGAYLCTVHGTVHPTTRHDADLSGGHFDPRCPICGEFVHATSTSELSNISPKSIYGVTKFAQEMLCRVGCESIGIPFAALRYQNVYGPGQSLKNPYTGILSIFSNLARQNEGINIFEDGLESRDFVFVDDVVSATVGAIFAPPDVSGAFNIGTGVAISVHEVATALVAAYRSSSSISISGSYRIGDIRHNYADITAAANALGYIPATPFEKGLKAFCDWVVLQDVHVQKYQESLDEMRALGLLK